MGESMANMKRFLRPHRNHGNALIFVMIFIVLASLGAVYMLRTRGNQTNTSKNQNEKMVVSQAAQEAMLKIKGNILDSIAYFSNLRAMAVTPALVNSQVEPKFNVQYADLSNYDNFLNNCEDPNNSPSNNCNGASGSSHRRLRDFFIDWARKSYKASDTCLANNHGGDQMDCWDGFRSQTQQRVIREDGITYEFSVRCLKDETYLTTDPIGYLRGDHDGCPIGFLSINDVPPEMQSAIAGIDLTNLQRKKWSAVHRVGAQGQVCDAGNNAPECIDSKSILENWVRLPKKLEILVSARRGDTIANLREIAEGEPVVLNDYAYNLGSLPRTFTGSMIKESEQFNFFAGQFYGRVHIEDSGTPLPPVCPDASFHPENGGSCDVSTHPYRVVMNAQRQSMNMFRPFTTYQTRVDAIDYLSGDTSVPLRTNNTSINFLGGYGSTSTPLNVADKIETAIATVRDLPESARVKHFSGTNCKVFLSGRTPDAADLNKVNVRCDNTGLQVIDLAAQPTTLYFENTVSIQQGAIQKPLAVYTAVGKDIRFDGSAFYDTQTTSSPSNQNLFAFQPYLPDNPDVHNLQNPLDISSSGGLPSRSIHSDGQAMAMWVSGQNIVIDGRPGHANP
jgi:Tfp pilus assembly protein PilX